jgi:hypothetical protein
MPLKVTADGYIHCGDGDWYSLDVIQQKVLEATNPGLHTIDTTGKSSMATLNTNDGHECECQRNKQQVSNEQPLPLPSTLVRKEDRREQVPKPLASNKQEDHLPLPSSFRRK